MPWNPYKLNVLRHFTIFSVKCGTRRPNKVEMDPLFAHHTMAVQMDVMRAPGNAENNISARLGAAADNRLYPLVVGLKPRTDTGRLIVHSGDGNAAANIQAMADTPMAAFWRTRTTPFAHAFASAHSFSGTVMDASSTGVVE